MTQKTRRDFMNTTAKSAVVFGMLAGTTSIGSAADKIRVAVVGVHGRGKSHIGGFLGLRDQGVELVAICDVDEKVLADAAANIKRRNDVDVKTYTDVRKMLEDDSIDAISIATPNHWHSLIGIWACEAGKDVYVEKPCSHNIYEGRKLVEAAEKYKRIVQHGTQIRSSPSVQEGMQLLKDGEIGEVYYAKGTCYKWRDTIGHTPDSKPPEGVHYDTWLGPAPKRAFSKNRFHYNWHWNWDYGNGDIGNQGVHQMDVARWGLDVGLPDHVASVGGHFMFKDDQNTPNTLVTAMKYENENKMLVFEVRHWITNDELMTGGTGNVVGNLFLGSEGIMIVPSYTSYHTFMGRKREPGKSRRDQRGEGNHFANFIEAVRSRKTSDLNAPIIEGHLSASLCHLANAAYRVEHHLHIDGKAERAIGDDAANELLTSNYRNPFVVPDKV